jgi:hypothetical protein
VECVEGEGEQAQRSFGDERLEAEKGVENAGDSRSILA